jgi:NAD(P)-dependent dehydrogenase (short-subunit alcohol dehydrogenase family)
MASYPELAGKVVAITGAVGNVGLATVQRLRDEQMRLVLIDRSAERAHDSFAALGLTDQNALAVGADVTQKADAERAIAEIVAHFGRIDALVNVAGTWRPAKPAEALDVDGWDFMMNINARSVFLMSGAAAHQLIKQGGGGRIVTVSSRSGLRGEAGNIGYSASKSAALRVTETLAAELMPHGITVNAILPSTIDTPQNREGMPKADHSRWVAPDSLAATIAFLLSDGARDISGASIPVYGRA